MEKILRSSNLLHNLTSSRAPHSPICLPEIMTIPWIPAMLLPMAMALSMSLGVWILLQRDVAAASAKAQQPASTDTASALPKLLECPTEPEEVHMANEVGRRATLIPVFMLKGDDPA